MFALDVGDHVVRELTHGGLFGLRLETRPVRLGRHPEDPLCGIIVQIFCVGALRLLELELGVQLLERAGDVPEKPLDEMRRERARLVAESVVKPVSHSMRLEAQSISKREEQRQKEELVQKLLQGDPKKLWQ